MLLWMLLYLWVSIYKAIPKIPRGRCYELRFSCCPEATWATQGQGFYFRNDEVVSRLRRCCFAPKAVIKLWWKTWPGLKKHGAWGSQYNPENKICVFAVWLWGNDLLRTTAHEGWSNIKLYPASATTKIRNLSLNFPSLPLSHDLSPLRELGP